MFMVVYERPVWVKGLFPMSGYLEVDLEDQL